MLRTCITPIPGYRDSEIFEQDNAVERLSYLAGLLHQICVTNLRKIIVFCD